MTMCGEASGNQNGSGLMRRVVDIMRKWNMIG
jgi:hypothetical protein